MALELENFKEVGGPGNSVDGGQTYSVFSETDTLGAMVASGYLNGLSETINIRDFILVSGTDGATLVQVSSITTAGVVTVRSLQFNSPIQSTSGTPVVVDITSPVTLHSMTATSNALTLAAGAVGQQKIVGIAAENSGTDTAILTIASAVGFATITFNDVGQSATLLFTSGGWLLIGLAGVTDPVVA